MAFWAENGYVGITQDSRGTFRSQGTFHPIVQEQADGYDAIEWAAAQPWSNGKVGMAGTSYFGVTQWQAALTQPAAPPGDRARADGDRLPRSLDVRERRVRFVVRAELAAELLHARSVPAPRDCRRRSRLSRPRGSLR